MKTHMIAEVTEGAEKLVGNKWVLYGGAALLAGVAVWYFASQQSAAQSSGSSASDGSYATYSPIAAVGSGGVSAGSSGSDGTDMSALYSLENTMSANNLQLGLAQVDSQNAASALNYQLGMAGLAVQQQGQNLGVIQTVMSSLDAITAAHKSDPINNVNGSFNIAGTTVSFNTSSNTGEIQNVPTVNSNVSKQLVQNAALVSTAPTSSGSSSGGQSSTPPAPSLPAGFNFPAFGL